MAAPEVINRARFSFEQSRHDCRAMVVNMYPVAHVEAVAVDRQRFGAQCLDDHKRNQFLRKLIASIVVRTTGDNHLLTIGLVGGKHEKIGARFTRRVWRARSEGRLLGELSSFS